jgi:hypothetical protein
MPYQYWLAAITQRDHHEHGNVLNQSLTWISPANFVRLLGEKQFCSIWKNIANDANLTRNPIRQSKIILDGFWAYLMTGFFFTRPDMTLNKPLSKGLKTVYLKISEQPTSSIYQVAKQTQRPYSRVYQDVKTLQQLGLVHMTPSKQSGRTVKLLSLAAS